MSHEKCNPENLSACEKCYPVRMFKTGCCSVQVAEEEGFKAQTLVHPKTGEKFQTCEKLYPVSLDEPVEISDPEVASGKRTLSKIWRCSIHSDPDYPSNCATYECHRVKEDRSK
jgi:hypothetical protein